jgi:hypothetical protein
MNQLAHQSLTKQNFDKSKLDFNTGLYHGFTSQILNRNIITRLYLACELSFKEIVELEYLRYNDNIYNITPELLTFCEAIELVDGVIEMQVNVQYFDLLKTIMVELTKSQSIDNVDEFSMRLVAFPKVSNIQLSIECPRELHVFCVNLILLTIIND